MKFWRRKKVKGKEEEEPSKYFLTNGSKFLEELIKDCNGISNPIRMFSFDQISNATNHFDDTKRRLFKTGFYNWYQGDIEDRPYVIKISIDSKCVEERWCYNDIVLSARVSNHSNFLKLIGCSLEFELPVLVFENPEFRVLNKLGSVGSEDGSLLAWNVRLKIAKDVAVAVTYLHTAFSRIIIHRDIKPENVFLDKNWNAKLTNFLLSVTLPEGKTWIEDNVTGTMGYLDPNYYSSNLVTEYTDVYSFGIFMLVLLMGRPAIFATSSGDRCNILDYVKDLVEGGEPVEFGGDSNDMRPGQMQKFLELALRCCEMRNVDRPKMISVAKEIKLIETSLYS